MRQHGGKEIDLIGGFSSRGYIVHLALLLELGKDAFLGTTAIVEAQDLFG